MGDGLSVQQWFMAEGGLERRPRLSCSGWTLSPALFSKPHSVAGWLFFSPPFPWKDSLMGYDLTMGKVMGDSRISRGHIKMWLKEDNIRIHVCFKINVIIVHHPHLISFKAVLSAKSALSLPFLFFPDCPCCYHFIAVLFFCLPFLSVSPFSEFGHLPKLYLWFCLLVFPLPPYAIPSELLVWHLHYGSFSPWNSPLPHL